MLIVGDKEREEKTVSVRRRDKGDVGAMKVEEFIEQVIRENFEKTIF